MIPAIHRSPAKITSHITGIAATTTRTWLVGANLNRAELIVANNSGATLYLSLGGLPSATNYSVAVPPNGTFFTPSTDRVGAVWSSATGQANVTERLSNG